MEGETPDGVRSRAHDVAIDGMLGELMLSIWLKTAWETQQRGDLPFLLPPLT